MPLPARFRQQAPGDRHAPLPAGTLPDVVRPPEAGLGDNPLPGARLPSVVGE